MNYIRQAGIEDASRLAEILIFTKRVHYRSIFCNDRVSFGEMQVLPLALEYKEKPGMLDGVWVYDDEFVKGMIHIAEGRIQELYVEPFFQGKGIGAALIDFAVWECGAWYLFVLEKNEGAIRFYQKQGFVLTEERQLEPGTAEYIVKMVKNQV